MIHTLKKYYVCYRITERRKTILHWPDYDTIAWQRKDSIRKLLTQWTGIKGGATWAKMKDAGWRCVKVNISFTVVDNFKIQHVSYIKRNS